MSLKDIAQETLKIIQKGNVATFCQWLNSPRFEGCFERVVFAIYDPTKEKETLKAFHPKSAFTHNT